MLKRQLLILHFNKWLKLNIIDPWFYFISSSMILPLLIDPLMFFLLSGSFDADRLIMLLFFNKFK